MMPDPKTTDPDEKHELRHLADQWLKLAQLAGVGKAPPRGTIFCRFD